MQNDWKALRPASDPSHHVGPDGAAAYTQRFDQVLEFHAPGLAPVQRGEDAWHITPDGRPAYRHRFRRTFGFYEGLAAVVSSEGWHHIAPTGAPAYPQRYAWCGNFQGGRCAVRRPDDAYFHITPEGAPAYPDVYRYAGDFRDGFAVVQADHGRSTHIDLHGRFLHDRWFLDLDVFHKGYARARDDAGWTHIDAAGVPAYPRRFASVEPFYNGQARVERFDGALEVIDETGATVTELRPPLRSDLASLSGDMVGFWRTQTIAAAVELGVIEALPATADHVAARCNLDPSRTSRLLRALGELALTLPDGTTWRTTPRGDLLRRDHPMTMAGASVEYARHFPRLWDALPEALRADRTWRPPDIFGDVARDEARRAAHHQMLLSYARHDYPLVPAALDLRGDERVIDAGGGLGALANLLLDTYPDLQVTVLDRPEVIEQAVAVQQPRPGLSWRSADLLQPWRLEADVVVLARVLHDWDDATASRILRQAFDTVRDRGVVFVVEMVLPDPGVAGGLCDLHLLMATGGQERTEADFRRLFAASGLELVEVIPLTALPTVLVGRAP